MARAFVPLLTLVATATAAVLQSGYLVVTNETDKARIGCVTSNGRISTSGCASFSLTDGYKLFQGPESGVQCTTTDTAQPENTDAHYGNGVFALTCDPSFNGRPEDFEFWSIDGTTLCTGNLRCTWDLKTVPGSGIPAWPFMWGSLEYGVPPGHVHAEIKFSPTP